MAALLDFTESSVSVAEPQIINTYLELQKESVQSFGDQSHQLITIDPNDCILWPFADRPSDELGDIESLAQSLKEHGQQEPILVRENKQNTPHRYEIIFGNRRWRAAHFAHISLLAICKNISDQQASLCQKEENENRKEISDYARAMSYRAQIDGGVFKSETELSKILGISKQALNDLMAYLRVPENLRAAISNYKTLSKKMVIKIATLSKNADCLDVLMHLAPKISDQTVTTSNIDQRMQSFLSPGSQKKPFIKPEYEKRDTAGNLLFKTKPQDNGDVIVHINRRAIIMTDIELFQIKLNSFLMELSK